MLCQNRDFLPYALLVLIFIAVAIFRPLLPVDETRYLTVAWEMFLRHDYLQLSVNFEPYHHKPPLLFWLINLSWAAFGVSREAALIPVFLASISVIALTTTFAKMLWGERSGGITPYLVLGSLPFVAYSSMMMFDMMMAAFTLACHIFLLRHARTAKIVWPVLAGLMLGLAFLTKGPVALLYVLGPVLLYPFWKQDGDIAIARYYRGFGLCLLVSLIPVLLWLVPLSMESDKNFLLWLLWKQSAGRITGNFNAAHGRPFYFYLLLLPAMFVPWIFFPRFWSALKKINIKNDKRAVFILSALIPAFLIFSIISGKQPHYLVPLFPYAAIALSSVFSEAQKSARITAIAMTSLFIAGHAMASFTVFPHYDLQPYAARYREHADKEWAFVRNYQGEIGFLARVERPITSLTQQDLGPWLQSHPDGYALVRHQDGDAFIQGLTPLYAAPYRGKTLGIFQAHKE